MVPKVATVPPAIGRITILHLADGRVTCQYQVNDAVQFLGMIETAKRDVMAKIEKQQADAKAGGPIEIAPASFLKEG